MAHVGKLYLQIVRVISFIFLVSVVNSDKYSKDANIQKDKIDQERPFRINKLNIHWQTAKKSLTKDELPGVYAELVIQDKMELEWKKRKADGGDEDGEQEAALRKRLNDILMQHGVKGVDKDYHSNHILGNDIDLDEELRANKKLAKLWKKAQMAGFSEEELDALRTEFIHHQEKVDELEQLKTELNDFQDISENSIHRFQDGRDSKKLFKEKSQELKSKYRDIKQDYEYLSSLSQESLSPKDMTFKNPKVVELWSQAKRANFSEDELLSFKEELRHFEVKLEKHEVLQREAEMAAVQYNSPAGKVNKLSETNEKLETRVNDYGRKMKKIHTELKLRINNAMDRTEL